MVFSRPRSGAGCEKIGVHDDFRQCHRRVRSMIEFKALMAIMNADGSRSSALASLSWSTLILVGGLFGAWKAGAPIWIQVVFVILIVANQFVFLRAYRFLLLKDRDALRSERYSLSKMQIERGMVGDNAVGLMKDETSEKLLEAGDSDGDGKP
jgi:hypothetical protein